MRTLLIFTTLFVSQGAFSQDGFLKPEDQKFFKNDSLDGKNKWERIDANVAEINRLHGMVAELKGEIARLKADVEELKKKK
ncbi:MAG: hypothetical protein V4598_08470 [Bdellovibrionota bacterium]